MPPAAGWLIHRSRELTPAAGWLVRRVRELTEVGARAGAPLPPRRLRARTGAPGVREFLDGGREAALELSETLSANGLSFASVGSVLDFGCGSGRVLPHVAGLGARGCVGCDVDAAAITWAARHRPQCDWVLSAARPPLPFSAATFELVYSISVFSHLAQEQQDAWLRELRRVLVPGGVALLSVHGAHAFEQFRTGAVRSHWCSRGSFERGPLGAEEFVFVPYARSRWNAIELPGVGEEYGLAFHSGAYVERHWAEVFEVVDLRERAVTAWQDLVVLRAR